MINRYSILSIAFLLYLPTASFAEGDLTAQSPIVKTINLGNSKNELRFFPNSLNFRTGKLYKLVIKNPSSQKHYFTSEAMSRSVFTRKVQINDKSNKAIAEVKGTVSEIEVYPGGTSEWWFVPIKTMKSSQLHCTIKGHTEAGMTGKITIQ